MRRRLAIVLVMLCPALVPATTYVVDNGFPGAADTNAGTRETPLLTISAAANRAAAGDEVLVRPGIYREAVTLTRSGAREKPIVFRSEVPGAAVVSGAAVLTNLQEEGHGVWSACVVKQDVTGAAWLGGLPQWVYVDGEPLERADSRDRLVSGSFFQDTNSSPAGWRVYIAMPEGYTPGNAMLEYACREGLFAATNALTDITISGFTVRQNADWFRGKGPISVIGERWLVESNHVVWTSYGGVTTRRSADCVVRGNVIEWCGCWGIGGGPNIRLTVEGNIIRNHNWRRFNWGCEGGGSKWVSTIDSRIVGNEVANNCGPGIWFDGGNGGNIYEHNICHDNSAIALFPEICWNEIIQDNIVYNSGAAAINLGNSPGCVVRRNILFNNAMAVGLDGNYTRANDHELKWYPHFVAAMATLPGLSAHRATQWEADFFKYFVAPRACLLNNNVIWENLMFDNSIGFIEDRDYRKLTGVEGFVNNLSDHNLFWGTASNRLVTLGLKTAYSGLDEWRRWSGRDEHSSVIDPLAPGMKLPAWAEACRAEWDRKMRPISEMDGTSPEGITHDLYRSPMAQIAIGRMLRSPYLEKMVFRDSRIHGALFDVEGERTLALWTATPVERAHLRLQTGLSRITVEDGFMVERGQELSRGQLDVLVTYKPLYVRRIGHGIAELKPGAGTEDRALRSDDVM